MKQLKQRIYEPITKENTDKVFADINKNQEEYVDLVAVPTHDMLILIYYAYDKTMPTEEDVKMYSNQTPQNGAKGFDLDTIKEYIKQYKIFVIIAALAAGYYFFFIRGA